MDQEINNLINKEIDGNEVCLFMKGTPDAPQCGFSMAVSNVLKHLQVNFKGINVLAVSYTHLRAHETSLHLVSLLLL